jgi:hypothetical protein
MEELKEFNLLDYKITCKKIVDAIHHLKNGKTSGLGGIPSEMLKAKQVVLFSLHYSKNYLILYFKNSTDNTVVREILTTEINGVNVIIAKVNSM